MSTLTPGGNDGPRRRALVTRTEPPERVVSLSLLGMGPALIGIAVAFAMVTIAATLGTNIAVWALVVVLTGFGFGFGFAAPNLMTTAITWAPADRAATASGLFSTSRYSGSIPASSLFAAMVGTGREGIDELLVIAAVCAAAAVAASSLVPDQAQPSPRTTDGAHP